MATFGGPEIHVNDVQKVGDNAPTARRMRFATSGVSEDDGPDGDEDRDLHEFLRRRRPETAACSVTPR